jgi:phosphoglycerate kinase
MKTKTIQNVAWNGERVFMRVDFNVPLSPEGKVEDSSRVDAALPTIRYLLDKGVKLVLASHLGRPKGKRNPQYSLKPVATYLAEALGKPVLFAEDCIGESVEALVNSMQSGQVVLLENLRFHPEEEANDVEFSKKLARLADAYVNDAFGTAHRAHASTEGVAHFLSPKVAGLLVEKELTFLGEKTANPDRPFVVILGGAKVSDKIQVIDALLDKADKILIGGAMAYTFKLALGGKVGTSLCEPDQVNTALRALEKAKVKGVEFLLPSDTLCTDSLDFGSRKVGNLQVAKGDIPDGWEGVDIGPETAKRYAEIIAAAKTILWNGPMGIFEIKETSNGTFAVAKAVAESSALSIIGGGDSVKAIHQSGYSSQVDFMSTGGGASLEFLEGKNLPGVAVLDKA